MFVPHQSPINLPAAAPTSHVIDCQRALVMKQQLLGRSINYKQHLQIENIMTEQFLHRFINYHHASYCQL